MYKRMPEPRMLCLQNWYHNLESWEKKPVWNPIILSYFIQVYPSLNITRVQISRLMHPSSRSRKPCRHVVETSEPSEATDIHKALPINWHHSESFRIIPNQAESSCIRNILFVWRHLTTVPMVSVAWFFRQALAHAKSDLDKCRGWRFRHRTWMLLKSTEMQNYHRWISTKPKSITFRLSIPYSH